MADEDEIEPSVDLGDDENGDMSNWTVSKMISFLKSCFLPRDFANVERVLSAREEKSKLEIKRLEANCYKFEEERLEKMGLANEVKQCKKELEELRSEVSKLRAENMVLKERDKFAEDKCKRLSDGMESMREKAHENIELRSKNCDLECAKAKAESDLEIERLKLKELENRVLKIESGFTMLIEQDDPMNNNEIGGEIGNLENGHSPNAPTDSPVKANGNSLNAGSRGLLSENIIEIVDSDDDCAPEENLSEKRMTPPTGNSHSAHISVANGTQALKRKETSSVDVCEGETGDNDALSENLKMRKLREPVRNPDDCPLNHCSTTSIHSDSNEVNREHRAESEQMPQGGFNLDGLRYSKEISDSSESSESSESFDSDYMSLNLSQLASETQRESKI